MEKKTINVPLSRLLYSINPPFKNGASDYRSFSDVLFAFNLKFVPVNVGFVPCCFFREYLISEYLRMESFEKNWSSSILVVVYKYLSILFLISHNNFRGQL